MPKRSDMVIAVALALLGLLEPTVLGSVEAPAEMTAPVTALAMAALAFRRIAPGPAAAATLSVLTIQEILLDEQAAGMAVFFALLLAVGTLAARYGRHDAAAWGVATLALLGLMVAADPGADSGDFVYAGTMWAVAFTTGRLLRARQLRADALARDLLEVERRAEHDAQEAVEAERTRLARELHDVVAHGLSVIHVQARVAAQLVERDPDAARRAIQAVEGVAHDALGDMRRMLDVLRVEHTDELRPQPGVGELGALLARAREAGLPLEYEVEGDPVSLPPGVDLAVYRFVQEGLTNVLKHAGSVPTRVRLGFRPAEVSVEIVDRGDGRTQADGIPGHGLIGMRERAALFGGDLEAGPGETGGFRVRARIPLEAA